METQIDDLLPTRVGMFPPIQTKFKDRRPSPHPRGDVPGNQAESSQLRAFSPPAWGCSICAARCAGTKRLLPTRVGMFRLRVQWRGGLISSPHPRGDVSNSIPSILGFSIFSPPAWGCSVPKSRKMENTTLLPTRVGMFRSQPSKGSRNRASPHPRGDVPVCGDWRTAYQPPSPHPRGDVPSRRAMLRRSDSFSPPAWGCSGAFRRGQQREELLPTRVGMFRVLKAWEPLAKTSPHPRGDVYLLGIGQFYHADFSPPAWGCSVKKQTAKALTCLLPTRVGMFRLIMSYGRGVKASPHPRGDVPSSRSTSKRPRSFSPPAWGCSGVEELKGETIFLLPTRVGMFRQRAASHKPEDPSPHPRGDVPCPDSA